MTHQTLAEERAWFSRPGTSGTKRNSPGHSAHERPPTTSDGLHRTDRTVGRGRERCQRFGTGDAPHPRRQLAGVQRSNRKRCLRIRSSVISLQSVSASESAVERCGAGTLLPVMILPANSWTETAESQPEHRLRKRCKNCLESEPQVRPTPCAVHTDDSRRADRDGFQEIIVVSRHRRVVQHRRLVASIDVHGEPTGKPPATATNWCGPTATEARMRGSPVPTFCDRQRRP